MLVILMGVSGSGKTTVGKRLAELLNWQFVDADDFHSAMNVEKMSQNIPLSDADRLPWLYSLQTAIQNWQVLSKNVVLACSALKEQYRQILKCPEIDCSQVYWIYLKGDFSTIQTRLSKRQGHFLNSELLQSQFEILEEPQDALIIDIDLLSPEAIALQIKAKLVQIAIIPCP